MKTLFTVILSVLILTVSAQEDIRQRVQNLETGQSQIQFNLSKAHKRYSLGTMFIISGTALSITGAILHERNIRYQKDLDGNTPNPYMLMAGGAILTAGVVLQIDSFKFIGRAGGKQKHRRK